MSIILEIITPKGLFSRMNPVIFDLYSLSTQLEISLPAEDSFLSNSQDYHVEGILAEAFFTQLKNKHRFLVLDEAQRNIRLIEFLVKSNEGRASLIISGTPPHGVDTIDYGGSARSRCAQFTLSSLRAYEVLALLKALFVNTIAVKTWLDFWALFNGEPYLYRQFEKNLLPRLDENFKKRIAVEGIDDESLLEECSQILKSSDTGISKELRDEIGGSFQRNEVQAKIQKSVQQLLNRSILESVVKVSDFLSLAKPKSSTIIWNDSFIDIEIKTNHPTSLRSFKSRRGLGLEDLFKNVIAWHVWSSDLDSVLSLNCARLDICTLSYGGETDADLLLIERAPSDSDLSEVPRLKAFIFNVKTNSESFIGEVGELSKKKFRALCSQFAKNYQLTLCLACCEIEANQEKDIIQFWEEVASDGYSLLNRVVTLDDFLAKAPTIAVNLSKDGLVVERSWEKSEILSILRVNSNLLIQGRYRVGKTLLLHELCDNNTDWKYKEINQL
jgi:hypothetical protein